MLVWITARSVNSIDSKRQIADKALKKSYEELEFRVRERTAELSDLNKLLDNEIKERIKAESKLVILNTELENRVAERTNEITLANERLKILSLTSGSLLASDKPVELVNSLCNNVMRFLDCQVFFNFLVDDTKGKLNLNAYSGIPVEEATKIERLDFGSGVCGCVARNGTRMVEENISSTSKPETNLVRSFGIQAYACHPLLSQDKVIGTLSFGTKTRTTFSEDDLSLMKSITDQVAIALVRIRNEESLRRSEERYRSLMELSPGASFVNRNNRIVLLNSAARDLLAARSNEEILGKSPFEIFHPDSHDLIRRRIDKLIKGETVPPAFDRIVRTDGVIRDVEVVAARIVDSEGPAIQVIMSDITDRIEAERALKESKVKLEIALENGKIGTWEWETETGIFKWDERMERMFGYKPGSLEHRFEAFERCIHEEDLPHVRTAFNLSLAEGIPLNTVYRIKLKDESVSYISTKALVEKGNEWETC